MSERRQEFVTPLGNVITEIVDDEPAGYVDSELRALIANPSTSWRDRTNAQARLDQLEQEAEARRIDRRVQRRETARSTQLCTGSKVVTGTFHGSWKPGTSATMVLPAAPSLSQELATLKARVEEVRRKVARVADAAQVSLPAPNDTAPQARQTEEEQYMDLPVPYWKE
jgi:hypothetical protein